jgi:hypothetical protein
MMNTIILESTWNTPQPLGSCMLDQHTVSIPAAALPFGNTKGSMVYPMMRSSTRNQGKGAMDVNIAPIPARVDTMAKMTNGRRYVIQEDLSSEIALLSKGNRPQIVSWMISFPGKLRQAKLLSHILRPQRQRFLKLLSPRDLHHRRRRVALLRRSLTIRLGKPQRPILGLHQQYPMDPGMRNITTMVATFLRLTPGDHREGRGLTAEGIGPMTTGCRRDITDI